MPDHFLPELGFYALAGGALNTRDVIAEVAEAETIGIGSTFISERLNVKEACTVAGAIGAISTDIGIATGVTNFNTRNPLVSAAHAATMQSLTGGRYTLGVGRGIEHVLSGLGLHTATTAQLEDFAGLIRTINAGATVRKHDGPAGIWPRLQISPAPEFPTPLLMTAFGPNSLRLAARAFDAVVLHTFFSEQTTRRCVDIVRAECERIGRDPNSIRVWSCYATISTELPDDVVLKKSIGRLAGYLQGYGDLLVRTNKWDHEPLAQFRTDPVVTTIRGAIDTIATAEQLRHIETILPAEWIESAAIGSPEHCARQVNKQFDFGVDGVIMHGAAPAELAAVVERYRRLRNDATHAGLVNNPGLPRTGTVPAAN